MNRKNIIKLIEKYKNETKYKNNIRRIGIFGSYAREEDSDSSDIDVFVDLISPKMFDMIGIKQDLENLTKRNIDIEMLRERMNHFLKAKIEKEGIYV